METWMQEYEKQLRDCITRQEEGYLFTSILQVPEILPLMKEAFEKGTFNKDSPAIKATCKAFKIKHTYKDIAHFIANHK
jgi:hypothetical protein